MFQKCAQPFTFISTGTGDAWHGAHLGDKYIADGTINGKIVYRTLPRGYHFLWFQQMANNEKYWVVSSECTLDRLIATYFSWKKV